MELVDSGLEDHKKDYYISVFLDDDKKTWGLSVIEQECWTDWGSKKPRREFRTLASKKVKCADLFVEIDNVSKEFLEYSINIPKIVSFGPDCDEVKKCYKKFNRFKKNINKNSIKDMISRIKTHNDEFQYIDEDIKKILEAPENTPIDDIKNCSRIQGIFKLLPGAYIPSRSLC